jgi:tetratricopeptide (TPR) repeat protein
MSGQVRTGIWLLLVALASVGLAQRAKPDAAAELQQHYDDAQHFQQAGDLDRAAQQYRLFVSKALDELAVGEAHAGHYGKAAALFEQATSLTPESVAVTLDEAQAQLDAGTFAQAESLSRKALQLQGDSHERARAHEILGRALLRMNRDQEARKELEIAATAEPSFDHSYNLAIACLDLDDAPCATRIFSEMESAYGDTPGIHMDFGRAWGQSDFQPRAEAEFRKAIEEDPKLPQAHYCLAATYLQENANDNMKAAQAELEKELTISPHDFLTWAALGKIAANQQKYPIAERYLRRAIQLNPKNPDAWLYLGQMYFNTSRWSQSEAALRKAILLTTDPSRNRYQIQKAHYLLGRLLMQQGKEQQASAEMKTAQSFLQHNLVQDRSKLAGLFGNSGREAAASSASLAMGAANGEAHSSADPEDAARIDGFRRQISGPVADSYNNLGAIAAVRNDYSAAAAFFEQAAAWNPGMEGIDLNWGRAAFSAAKYDDAVKPLQRYLQAHPAEQSVRAPLGISQYMTGDYKGCVATLQRAGASLLSVPQVAFVYADSLVKTGQPRTGMQMLAELEKKNPAVPDVHRALGEAYAQQHQKQKAIEELREALRLNAGDQRARRDLQDVLLTPGAAPQSPPAASLAARPASH